MENKSLEQRKADQVDKYAELKTAQKQALIDGDEKMMKANKDSKFEIREVDKHMVHLAVSNSNAAPDGKSLIVEKKTVQVHAAQLNNLIKAGAFVHYDDVKVIHDPRKDAPKYYELKPTNVAPPGVNTMASPSSKAEAQLAAREEKLKAERAELDEIRAEIEAANQASGIPADMKKAPDLPDELGAADIPHTKKK